MKVRRPARLLGVKRNKKRIHVDCKKIEYDGQPTSR
jgi:hypothetical protein